MNAGLKEKLLEKILELFSGMPDQDEALQPEGEVSLEVSEEVPEVDAKKVL
jgi:hypothetical protein